MTDGEMADALSGIAEGEPIPNDEKGRARVRAHAEEARRRLAETQEDDE